MKISKTKLKIIGFIVLVLALNLLSVRYFLRADLTENNIYSLDSATKDIVSGLEQEVTIDAYISDNLPPSLQPLRTNVLDLLAEYDRFGNDKLNINLKDPNASDFSSQAQAAGIPEIPFGERSQDKVEIAQGRFGIVVSSGEEVDAIPVLQQAENLEYELTSRINKLTNDTKSKIGFISGHGEKSLAGEMTQLSALLTREFEVEEVDLLETKSLSELDDFAVLMLIGPSEDIPIGQQFILEQYLLRGGSVIALTETLATNLQSLTLTPIDSNVSNFLQRYGINLNQEVILDESYTPIQNGFVPIAYPYWVLVQNSNMANQLPPLNGIESATLFWPNSISIEETEQLKPLLSSTDDAWALSGDAISIDFENIQLGDSAQYTLAVRKNGEQTAQIDEDKAPKRIKAAEDYNYTSTTEEFNLIVFADADFVTDNFIAGNEQNPALLLNLIDWAASGGNLANIRVKSAVTRPLDNVSQSEERVIKAVNFLVVPTVVTLAGVIYGIRRRTKASQI